MLALVLLPIEAVFRVGFALPIPWLIGVARVAYTALVGRLLADHRISSWIVLILHVTRRPLN